MLLRYLGALGSGAFLLAAHAGGDGALPWLLREASWRTDRVWYDGLAEKCVYQATRTIYGRERTFEASAYTDKERADPDTTVKTEARDGLEVFKHHWSERVPTEHYDYDFSTSCYVRTEDLGCFKLTAATQEDCGASFKEIWRDDSAFSFFESVYFPDGGRKEGRIAERTAVFEDALPLVLRDFPFEKGRSFVLAVIPSQKDVRAVPFEPAPMTVSCAGSETLDLPCGKVDAFRIELSSGEEERARYWFAAEGAAPWLHALVRYEGPHGVTYRLSSIERTAYWHRG